MGGGLTNAASVSVNNALTLLATSQLSVAAASIDFSSIPTGFSWFVLKVSGDTASAGNLGIRFNNDSGSNYYFNQILASNTTVSGGATGPATYACLCITAGDKNVVCDYTIGNWLAAASMVKTWGGNGGTFYMNRMVHGYWNNTAAEINRITLFETGSANLKAGTKMSLYGVNVV